MPDSKAISNIAGNIEIVRKVVGDIQTNVNKIDDIINKGKLSDILNELSDKIDETRKATVEFGNSVGAIGRTMNTEKYLKESNNSMKTISGILSDISGKMSDILKKSNTNIAANNKEAIKILNDAAKESKTNKLMSVLNVVSKLREFSMKDFLTAGVKIKNIKNIYNNLVETFKKFKNEKEIKKVNDFVISSVSMIKKLSSISLLVAPASIAAKAFDKIIVGKNGLINMLKTISKHKKEIESGKKLVNKLVGCVGKLGIMSVALAAISIISVPAIIGVGALYAVSWGMVQISKLFEKNKKHIDKGINSMLKLTAGFVLGGIAMVTMFKATEGADWKQFGIIAATLGTMVGLSVVIGAASSIIKKGTVSLILMGAGYIAIGYSMKIMFEATKGADWKQFGIMVATVGSLGVLAAAAGAAFALISLGSIGFGLMGLSLISLGYGIKSLSDSLKGGALENVGKGIPKLIDALSGVFKSSKGNPSFGNSFLGMVTGALKMGGAILAAGGLMFIGFSLGMFGLSLTPWRNFDTSSVDNISYAINGLYGALGMKDNSSVGGGSIEIGDGILGLATAALNFGKSFFQIGQLLLVTYGLGMVRESISKWSNFDTSSVDNISYTYTKLREAFGLSGSDDGGGIASALSGGILGGIFELGKNLIKGGKSMFNLATTMIAVGCLEKIGESIKNIESPKKLDEILSGIDKLREYFKSNSFESIEESADDLYDGIVKISKVYNKAKFIGAKDLISNMERLSKINSNKMVAPFSDIVKKIDLVNLKKVNAMTDMFKAMASIKNRGVFGSLERTFDNLITAINGNTEALNDDNNTQVVVQKTESKPENNKSNNHIIIDNIEQLADMIADKLRMNIGGVYGGGVQEIDLRINNEGGNSWVITRN